MLNFQQSPAQICYVEPAVLNIVLFDCKVHNFALFTHHQPPAAPCLVFMKKMKTFDFVNLHKSFPARKDMKVQQLIHPLLTFIRILIVHTHL